MTIIGNRATTSKWNPISGRCLFFRIWDSKYFASIFPWRHCDHHCHNGNPDEEHMQLLSLNKISPFPLHPSTMGLSAARWLSSYSPGAIIAAKPLPPTSHSLFLSSVFTNHLQSLAWISLFVTSEIFLFSVAPLPLCHSLPLFLCTFGTFPCTQRNERDRSDSFRSHLIWSINDHC